MQAKTNRTLGKGLDRRTQRAIETFKSLELIYFHDLPVGVGRKTMALLVERGLVEVVEAQVGIYAKNYAWRLIH
jgi:hypothetical protein